MKMSAVGLGMKNDISCFTKHCVGRNALASARVDFCQVHVYGDQAVPMVNRNVVSYPIFSVSWLTKSHVYGSSRSDSVEASALQYGTLDISGSIEAIVLSQVKELWTVSSSLEPLGRPVRRS